MSKTVKKVFTEYMYPAAVMFDKNPIGTFAFLVATASLSWEWIPFALVGSFISIYAFDVFCRKTQEEDAREAKFKQTRWSFNRLNSFILDQRFFFIVSVEDVEAFQLCLSAIEQYTLVTQQQADLLFSAAKQASATSETLAQIASDIGMLDTQMRGVMRGYSRLKTRLQSYAPEQQLEAAKHWVADINRTSPAPMHTVEEDTNLGAVERDGESST
ncbi:hypothetical protein ARMGADRAFT_1057389 [Armillaria gallica]|uniref:Uncharacterized protein n=1 Tax=Armillaria gallica TaxID=47427 RepID=A0A2H3E2Q9_ARMGA|nr:hypothetical protein ARMGADRAFT_1057389 [Armillaria gallica]